MHTDCSKQYGQFLLHQTHVLPISQVKKWTKYLETAKRSIAVDAEKTGCTWLTPVVRNHSKCTVTCLRESLSFSRGERMGERTSTVTGLTMLTGLDTRTENSGSAWTNSTVWPVQEQELSWEWTLEHAMEAQHMPGTATSMWGTMPPTTYSPSVDIQGQQDMPWQDITGCNFQHQIETMTDILVIVQQNGLPMDGGSTPASMQISMDHTFVDKYRGMRLGFFGYNLQDPNIPSNSLKWNYVSKNNFGMQ